MSLLKERETFINSLSESKLEKVMEKAFILLEDIIAQSQWSTKEDVIEVFNKIEDTMEKSENVSLMDWAVFYKAKEKTEEYTEDELKEMLEIILE